MATSPGAAADRRTNPAVVGLVIVLVLVLLAAVYFLFLSGDGDDETAPPPTTAPAPTASPTVDLPEVEPGGGGGSVRSFELFAARDPFKPLVDDEAAAGGTTATGSTGTPTGTDGDADAGTDGDGGTGGTDGTGGTGTGGTGTGGTGGGQTGGTREVEGHRVKLVDVFTENGEKRAQVRVDGTVYTVSPGERFAENFEFVSASGQCATFLFGDDQFTLCEGQEILK
jgi:hypothetical protein